MDLLTAPHEPLTTQQRPDPLNIAGSATRTLPDNPGSCGVLQFPAPWVCCLPSVPKTAFAT
eukprot:8272569-Alexandrium_andersonii.AAC.1